jgi:hypothetical protein
MYNQIHLSTFRAIENAFHHAFVSNSDTIVTMRRCSLVRDTARRIHHHEPSFRRYFQGNVLNRHLSLTRPQSTSDTLSSSWTKLPVAAPARRWYARPSGSNFLPLTKRELADLEERICRAAGSVVDPILGQSLDSLQWLHRRLAVSSRETGGGNDKPTILRMLLKVPTLLHPGLPDLKRRIQESAESELKSSSSVIGQTLIVDVVAIATRPVPYIARWMGDHEEQDEFLRELGPGLANVAHIVAVYSCKVRSAPS